MTSNCRGGPPWPPQCSTLCFRAGAATEGRPYNCTLKVQLAEEVVVDEGTITRLFRSFRAAMFFSRSSTASRPT